MGALLASIIALTVQAAAPVQTGASSASTDAPAPTTERDRRRARRAERRKQRQGLVDVPTPMVTELTEAELRAQRNRARYLRLVDLQDPFAAEGQGSQSHAKSRGYVLADLRDPFLLATRSPRSTWNNLQPLPGDIRDPFRGPRPGAPSCTPADPPERTANGVTIQRPESVDERRKRTPCQERTRPPARNAGQDPADLRDPFPGQARASRR